jgi:hypothetical protein
MLDRKIFIASVAFLILLVAAPIMATEDEIGRFPEKGLAEKGSGRFVVDHTLVAAGIKIEAGAYNVKWESLGSNATVEFMPIGKSKGVTVPGKVVKVSEKFDFNNISVAKDPAGRDVIKELQFSGKRIKIIFKCEDPSCFHSHGNSEFPAFQMSAAGKDAWEMDPAGKIYG